MKARLDHSSFKNAIPKFFAHKHRVRCLIGEEMHAVTARRPFHHPRYGTFYVLAVKRNEAFMENIQDGGVSLLLHIVPKMAVYVKEGEARYQPLSELRFLPGVPDGPDAYPQVEDLSPEDLYRSFDFLLEQYLDEPDLATARLSKERELAERLKEKIGVALAYTKRNIPVPPQYALPEIAADVESLTNVFVTLGIELPH